MTTEVTFSYGTNPHLRPARVGAENELPFAVRRGDVSFNNVRDALHAFGCARELERVLGRPVAVAVKHGRPVGTGTGDGGFRAAVSTDPEAAENSWVAWTGVVDGELAAAVARTELDGLAAPAFDATAWAILRSANRRLRLLEIRRAPETDAPSRRSWYLGVTLEEPADLALFRSHPLRIGGSELDDPSARAAALMAMVVVRHTPARAAVAATAEHTVAVVGAACSEREVARRLGDALPGASQADLTVAGSVSFRDPTSLEALARGGVTRLVQPDPTPPAFAEEATRLGTELIVTGRRLICR